MARLSVHLIVHADFSHIDTALNSILANTVMPVDIYVTVNVANPNQENVLQARYPLVHFIVNETPKGFAANHNKFMKTVHTPFFALLNDDVYIHPGALDTLVAYLDAHPTVGLAGPMILNPDGTPQIAYFSDPTLLRMLYTVSGLGRLTKHGGRIRTTLQRIGIANLLKTESLKLPNQTREVPVITGVAMIVRQEACKHAGLMDEDTLVYGEEVSWHWRLRQHGWKIHFVAEAKVTHFNKEQDLKGWKLVEHRKGILNYFQRYRPRWQTLIIRCGIVIAHGLAAFFQIPFNRNQAAAHWKTVQLGLFWSATRNGHSHSQ